MASRDRNHIEKFKQNIESNTPIHDYNVTCGYKIGAEYSRIVISSPHMAESLILKGMFEHKSLTLLFPTDEVVPKTLTAPFIRGYFDGDGYITQKCNSISCGFCGAIEFLTKLSEILNLSKITIGRKRNLEEKNINNYSLDITRKQDVENFLNYIYSNSQIHLDRKYEKYLLYKSKQ